jgi:hypothetical protein
MTILEAIKDDNLFRPFLGELDSWQRWMVALRCLYGLPVQKPKGQELVLRCTGRDARDLPDSGFSTALFLVGRRSGKSRISAIIGAFEALFGGHEARLAKGETGIVAIISPSRYQSGIVWKYLSSIFDTPLLRPEVADCRESFQTMMLRNGLQILILTGDWRTVRGPSVVCAIVDEVCFFGQTEESKVRSDTELVRALRPALITTKGKLIAISSKYSKKGWAYSQWLRYHGCNKGNSPSFSPNWSALVWDAPSQVMNPTLPQSEIDAAYQEDPAAARSEFGGAWREDISEYIPRSVIEALVIRGRKELLPKTRNYVAFTDLSGGRNDSAALAIAHSEGGKILLDVLRLWKAPFNPYTAVREQTDELKRFGLRRVTGDNYAAEFVAQAFTNCGIAYHKAELSKSLLYRELLPRLCTGDIELLDDETLIDQIAGLERRTRSGGQDVIDHPPGGKDDLANALAGVVVSVSKPRFRVGGIPGMRREIAHLR